MHFVIGANIDDSYTTGMGRQMHGLGDALQAKGHRVEYLFADTLAVPNRRRWSRLEAPFRAAAALRRIARTADSPPIAILHEPIAWATALIAKKRVRTVAMVHACELKGWPVELATRAATGEQIKASSRIVFPLTELSQTYASLRLSDGVFCLSSSDLDYIVNRLGVRADRVVRIDNGVDGSFMGLSFDDAERTKDLLFVGSWIPRKGIRILLSALERIAGSGLRPTLTLAGTGLPENEIRPQLPEPWRSTAEILPHVPARDLVQLYRRHKILVLPSIAEGIPLVVLEAMACALCLVVTSVGGIPDVVDDGITGWVVPALDATALSDAMTRALLNPDSARSLGRAAHEKMQGYGWSRSASQVEEFSTRVF
jgi:glycosyltransferase involved in cell wall biosynthesis